jgi:pantothenate synthetase
MDSLAKMLKYPTEIETPVNTEEVILSMLGYAPKKNELSPRQMDMLNYHTSITVPSLYDKLQGGSAPQSVSVSFSNDDPIVIPDNITFSISEIQ